MSEVKAKLKTAVNIHNLAEGIVGPVSSSCAGTTVTFASKEAFEEFSKRFPEGTFELQGVKSAKPRGGSK